MLVLTPAQGLGFRRRLSFRRRSSNRQDALLFFLAPDLKFERHLAKLLVVLLQQVANQRGNRRGHNGHDTYDKLNLVQSKMHRAHDFRARGKGEE